MRKFESYPSRPKLLGLLGLNILMIAGCAFCLSLPEIQAKVVGAIGLLFFGFGLYAIPRAMFHTTHPRIIMDEAGITSSASFGLIEWADITRLRIDSIKGTKFISIFVADRDKYLGRMSKLARQSVERHPFIGLSEFTLCFVGLSPGLDEAIYFLKEKGLEVKEK